MHECHVLVRGARTRCSYATCVVHPHLLLICLAASAEDACRIRNKVNLHPWLYRFHELLLCCGIATVRGKLPHACMQICTETPACSLASR